MASPDPRFLRQFFHGTRANLAPGDLIAVGWPSNFGAGRPAAWVYMAATLEAAIWGAELAQGVGRERIYVVEPTGPVEDDPNVTDAKFPGNPTQSYRSQKPLRVTGEVVGWRGHPPEALAHMKEAVERMRREGVEAIE